MIGDRKLAKRVNEIKKVKEIDYKAKLKVLKEKRGRIVKKKEGIDFREHLSNIVKYSRENGR